MPETDAVLIDNLFCQPTWVEIRGGKTKLATFTGNAESLMAYNGVANNQMFGAVNNAGVRSIYRVDNAGGGAVGAAVVGGGGGTIQPITNANYDFCQFGTGNVEALYLVNGADPPLYYDGTTWVSVTAVSTPALTNLAPLSQLSQVVAYKYRLWFLQKNSMNVWYLPQNVVGGALTELILANVFKLGGAIVAMITVSIDNTAGTQDYIAFVTNQGEVVMFQGYDPAAVATWSVAAHFRIGAPIGSGRACWQKMGMDAAIICQDGLALLSEAMLTDRSQNKLTLSDKIRYGINQAIALYGTNVGWQLLLYPPGNKLILNVPTNAARTASYQYVMQTLTGAWVTWGQMSSPLNATCWENLNNQLYFGTSGVIYQADTGLADDGAPITWSVKQAYNYMGERTTQKRWCQAQPVFQASAGLSVAFTMSSDFDPSVPSGSIPVTTVTGSKWNVALWGSPWGDVIKIVRPWIGLTGVGFAGAIYMQGSTNNVTMRWMSTNVVFEPGGTFYGK